jgi:hypothetical protein
MVTSRGRDIVIIVNKTRSSRPDQKPAKASSYAKPSVIFACCSMWSKLRYATVSSVECIFLDVSSIADSITKADGNPYRLAEAWSEHA